MSQGFAPRDYQLDIIGHQADVARGATFAGMGTGKTVSSLTAVSALQLSGELTSPVLVVAPYRVAVSTWPDEAKKWSHLSGLEVVPVLGDGSTRHRLLFGNLARGNAAVYTVNYDNIVWLVQAFKDGGVRWPFEMVIADESTKLKGFRLQQGTVRAKTLASIAHTKAKRWVNLTGTPSPNGLKDLWGQTWFLDGGKRLGLTFTAFEDRWFRMSRDGYGLEPLPFAQEEIESRLRDICITVVNPLGVGRPLENEIRVRLPANARAAYRDMEKQMFAEIAGHEIEAVHAASRTLKCLQLANGAAYVDELAWVEVHDQKLQALESVIEEAAGEPVLVAYHFRSDLERLRRAFPKARVLDKNPRTIQDWNAGKIPILLAHPASAGHGLNLQDGGRILVFFSLNWNLEEHDQIIERIGPTRQKQAGHERQVYIHYILAEDTVDEVVLERLRTKRGVQELLLAAMQRKGAT